MHDARMYPAPSRGGRQEGGASITYHDSTSHTKHTKRTEKILCPFSYMGRFYAIRQMITCLKFFQLVLQDLAVKFLINIIAQLIEVYAVLHVNIIAPQSLAALEFDTTSGDLILTLPADHAGFTARLDTASGTFTSELSTTATGNIHRVGDGSLQIDMDSTSSDLSIRKGE